MFPYDPHLAAVTKLPPGTVPAVLQLMQTIDATCADGDGLKWFNWLYLQVTEAVEQRIEAGGFNDPPWLAELDVQFAKLYFTALHGYLTDGDRPDCWEAMFSVRTKASVARIQFAMAGINAHINHDLALAIFNTCRDRGTAPEHFSPQYDDYTALNADLDGLIESAKKTLNVRLWGDALPPVSHLEDTLAGWGTAAAREQAWVNSEVLWHLEGAPLLASGFMESLDGFTAFAGKGLLTPVP